MDVTAVDTSRFEEMIGVMESVAKHKRDRTVEESDTKFYELMAAYNRRALEAKGEGKMVVAHTVMVPNEILYAMDIIPFQLDNAANTMVTSLRNQEEVFGIAKEFGFVPDLCSAHRAQTAMGIKGWYPQVDAVVWSHQICDNSAKSGGLVAERYGVPSFFLDRPYGASEEDINYYAAELGEMVSFLEESSGRRMDWDRLLEVLGLAQQMTTLHREINEIKQAVPSPMANRRGSQLSNIGWLMAGTWEGVNYFTKVRDELKDRVNRGVGFIQQEKHRLLGVFPPPPIKWKLLDWMEKEHGAVVVADPLNFHWGEWEMDAAKPLDSSARRYFALPTSRQLHGPAADALLKDVVEDAWKHRVDGAIYWANIACRQGCAAIKSVKDVLRDRVGIPTVVADSDMLDPSIAPDEETKDKLEAFFELLEDRK